MAVKIRGSVLNLVQKNKLGATGRVVVQPAGAGATPNGNTIIRNANNDRTVCTIRNVADIEAPGATDAIRYGYTDDVNLATNGFSLKPNEAYDVDAPDTIYAVSITANPVPVDFDEGTN